MYNICQLGDLIVRENLFVSSCVFENDTEESFLLLECIKQMFIYGGNFVWSQGLIFLRLMSRKTGHWRRNITTALMGK